MARASRSRASSTFTASSRAVSRAIPTLRPEKSRGGEVGLRLPRPAFQRRADALSPAAERRDRRHLRLPAVDHRQRRRHQQAPRDRSRSGWTPSDALRLTATYAFLDASEPTAPGGAQLQGTASPPPQRQRRDRRSRGRLSYGAAIAYTGERVDTDFTPFPAVRVDLRPTGSAAPDWPTGSRAARSEPAHRQCVRRPLSGRGRLSH